MAVEGLLSLHWPRIPVDDSRHRCCYREPLLAGCAGCFHHCVCGLYLQRCLLGPITPRGSSSLVDQGRKTDSLNGASVQAQRWAPVMPNF